jgi:polar amino acid transport system substrate-binding protein
MGVSHGRSILGNPIRRLAWLLPAVLVLSGCGLLIDAIEMIQPIAADEVQAICLRQRVQIGMAAEPFRPFVFPAIWTDEGARVTGLDVEIVTHITAALSRHCGTAITPVLHLIRFRDLFTLLNEGQLDLFVSAVAANIPSPTRAGLAYSTPYFYNGGIGGITARERNYREDQGRPSISDGQTGSRRPDRQ